MFKIIVEETESCRSNTELLRNNHALVTFEIQNYAKIYFYLLYVDGQKRVES